LPFSPFLIILRSRWKTPFDRNSTWTIIRLDCYTIPDPPIADIWYHQVSQLNSNFAGEGAGMRTNELDVTAVVGNYPAGKIIKFQIYSDVHNQMHGFQRT
jgi:hypothetical protein